MKAQDYLKLFELPDLPELVALELPHQLVKAAAVEANLLIEKGTAGADMARIIGQAIRQEASSQTRPSATAAEKGAKAGPNWLEARRSYDQAHAGLKVVQAYSAALRHMLEHLPHAQG